MSAFPEHVPAIPHILQAGDNGKGQREPEEGGHQEGFWISKPREEEVLLVECLEEEPDECSDAKADLKAGLPFAAPVSGNYLALLDGDLAQTRNEELAGENDHHNPDGTEALLMCAQENECGGSEDLVCNGIQQLAEGGYEVEPACEVTVQEVSESGYDEGQKGDAVAGSGFPHEGNHEDSGENEARDGEGVREIQRAHCGGKFTGSPTTLRGPTNLKPQPKLFYRLRPGKKLGVGEGPEEGDQGRFFLFVEAKTLPGMLCQIGIEGWAMVEA